MRTLAIEECYEILGLKLGAPKEAVRGAYIRLVKIWHPDRFINDIRLKLKAEEKLKRINAAYEVLKGFTPAEGIWENIHASNDSSTYTRNKTSTESKGNSGWKTHSEPKDKPNQASGKSRAAEKAPGAAYDRRARAIFINTVIGFFLVVLSIGVSSYSGSLFQGVSPAPRSKKSHLDKTFSENVDEQSTKFEGFTQTFREIPQRDTGMKYGPYCGHKNELRNQYCFLCGQRMD